jgi:hypothetical protein
METLRSAERAAGFAMAASDEFSTDCKPFVPQADAWRRPEAVLPSESPKVHVVAPLRGAQRHDWMRALTSFFGRRAPA